MKDGIEPKLKNFWNAVAEVNPRANDEPETNVLWAPIGSSACHIAFAAVLKTMLDSPETNLRPDRFVDMLKQSAIAEYGFWFTKKGKPPDEQYPSGKGEAPVMTGAANYKRLAKELDQSWRSNLHAKHSKREVRL